MPAARVQLGDRDVPLPSFANDQAAGQWLVSLGLVTEDSEAEQAAEWVLFRGSAARTGQSVAGQPLLSHRWRVETSNDPRILERIAQLRAAYYETESPVARLPSAHPLVVDNQVLIRTTDGLLGVDFVTGKRIWQSRPNGPDALAAELDNDAPLAADPFGQLSGAGSATSQIEQAVWGDLTRGMLSSDGQTLYVVEDQDFAAQRAAGPRIVLTNGQLARGAAAPNRLQAHALGARQGKLKWQIGDPGERVHPELQDACFLGPPLPLEGLLYTLAEIQGEIRLIVLDAETGRFVWKQQLAVVDNQYLRTTSGRQSQPAAGVTPSFADGVLICPTSEGAVVAVDVANRSLRWGYQYDRSTERSNRAVNVFGGVATGSASRSDAWVDTSATLAEGLALLTPIRSRYLHCLRLMDGQIVWKADREDSLYVACVHKNAVIVVGHDKVRAFRLKPDGTNRAADDTSPQSAWEQPLKLPEGAVPSGRGFQSDARYYLPLSNATIAVIDLNTGAVAQTIESRDGAVPGNLVPYRDSIISQSADFVDCYYQLEPLRRDVDQRLANNPDDAEALTLKSIILQDEGGKNLDTAIDLLRRSLKLQDDPRTRDLLVSALLSAMEKDFAARRDLAPEIQRLIVTDEQRGRYLRVWSAGLVQAGEFLPAFDAYLKLADLRGDSTQLERINARLEVRRDRWVRARLEQLYKQSSPSQQAEMDKRIQRQLEDALAPNGVEALRAFVSHFGHSRSADRAREALVARLEDRGALLASELALERLEQTSPGPQTRASLARLAALLAEANRFPEAADYYRRLQSRFPDQACLDGKTPRELIEALPADSPIRGMLRDREKWWPTGRVTQRTEQRGGNGARNYVIELVGGQDSLGPQSTILWDSGRQQIIGKNQLGEELWRVAVSEGGNRLYFVNASVNRAGPRPFALRFAGIRGAGHRHARRSRRSAGAVAARHHRRDARRAAAAGRHSHPHGASRLGHATLFRHRQSGKRLGRAGTGDRPIHLLPALARYCGGRSLDRRSPLAAVGRSHGQ